MTKQEFLQLTHQREIDDEKFNDINSIYTLLDFDKEDFCKLWTSDKEQLCFCIADAASRIKQSLESWKKNAKDLAFDVLNEQDTEAEKLSYFILGTAGAIKAKLAGDTELSDDDIEYISNNLQ